MGARLTSVEELSNGVVHGVSSDNDGGVFHYFDIRTDKANFWLNFFAYCNDNKGNYKAGLVMGGLWALMIPFVITCYLLIRCCRACAAKHQTKACRSVSNHLVHRFKTCWPGGSPVPSIKTPETPQGRVLNALLVFIVLLLLLFSAAILLSFAAGKPVQAAFDEPSSPSSVRGIANTSIGAVERFVVRSVWGGERTSQQVITDFTTELQSIIKTAVGNFTNGLLQDYGVTTLFITAQRVITDIQNVQNAMDFVKQSQNNIFVRYHEFNGFVNTNRDLLKSLDKMCQLSMTTIQKQECLRLLQQSKKLEVNIDQSKINFDSSTSLLFILKEMKVNITNIANDLNKARTAIDSQLNNVYASIQKDFNLDAIFGSLDNVWEMAKNFSESTLLTPLGNMRNGEKAGFDQQAIRWTKINLHCFWALHSRET